MGHVPGLVIDPQHEAFIETPATANENLLIRLAD
jgi:hypothetical protein